MKLEFLGHLGLLVQTASHSLVVDPFITGNPLTVHKVEDIEVDYNAFDSIKVDVQAFKADLEAQTASRCVVLEPGQQHKL